MALALVGIAFPWIETTKMAKAILQELLTKCEIIETTALFKRKNEKDTDFEATIEFVISISTSEEVLEFSDFLEKLAQRLPKQRDSGFINLKLLIYDQVVMMTPELTLPHPDLQYDSLTLRLSSEIWSRYEHPILKQTLREIADRRSENIYVQFIMQGQNLFD